MKQSNFFQLKTPADLLRKARHDFRRVTENRLDPYAAFDFLVTICHFPDWLKMCGVAWSKPETGVDAALLSVIAQVANGAKHFVMASKVPGGTEVHEGAFGSGFGSSGFNVDALFVRLGPTERAALDRDEISVEDLGHAILAYWRYQAPDVHAASDEPHNEKTV